MDTIPFDFALKIAHYFQIYFRVSRRPALEFAFWQEREATTEYNFGGIISGKFVNTHGRWFVVGYADPLTHNQKVLIELVNVKLAALKQRLEDGKRAWPTEKDPVALRDRTFREWQTL